MDPEGTACNTTTDQPELGRGKRRRAETDRFTPDVPVSNKVIPDEVKSSKKNKQKKRDGAKEPYINRRVAKAFYVKEGQQEVQIFFGTIDKLTKKTKPYIWHVHYDDEDEEEFYLEDLKLALETYKNHRDSDPRKKPAPKVVNTDAVASVKEEGEVQVEVEGTGQPQIGDRVFARYGPSGLWYWGKVTNKFSKSSDLCYSIQYDDGDFVELHKASDGIATEAQYEKGRPVKKASTSPRERAPDPFWNDVKPEAKAPVKKASTSPSERAPEADSNGVKPEAKASERPRRKAAPKSFVDLSQDESEEEDMGKATSKKISEEDDSDAVIEIEDEEDDDSTASPEEPPAKRARALITTKDRYIGLQAYFEGDTRAAARAFSGASRATKQADMAEEIDELVEDAIQDYDIPTPSESDLNMKESLDLAKKEFRVPRLLKLLRSKLCVRCGKKLGMYYRGGAWYSRGEGLRCSTCYRDAGNDESKWTISYIERTLGVTFLAVVLLQDQINPEHVETLSRLHTIDETANHQQAYRAYIKEYGHLSFGSLDISKAIYRRYGGVWAMHYAMAKSAKNLKELGSKSPQEIAASVEVDRLLQEAIQDYTLKTSTSDRNLEQYLEPFKERMGSQALLKRLESHICHMDGCNKLGMYFSRRYASKGSDFTCSSCFKENGKKVYESSKYVEGDMSCYSYKRHKEDQDWTPKQAETRCRIEGFGNYLENTFPYDSRASGKRVAFTGSIKLYSDCTISHALYGYCGGVAAIHCLSNI